MTPFISEIFNAEVLFREDCSPDEFIDVIVGNRVYMPCLYVSICCCTEHLRSVLESLLVPAAAEVWGLRWKAQLDRKPFIVFRCGAVLRVLCALLWLLAVEQLPQRVPVAWASLLRCLFD